MTDKEKQLAQDMKELVADINNHFQNSDASKRISPIELEILSSNIRALYDKSILLKYLRANASADGGPATPVTAAPPVANVSSEALAKDEALPKDEASTKEEQPNPEPVRDEVAPEPVVEAAEPAPEPVAEDQPDVETPAPTPAPEDAGRTVGERIKMAPIEDLRKAIGINQKYLLMNDLFHGENSAFNEALDKLNGFASGGEAMEYVNSDLAPRFKWDLEDDSVQNFIELVERRYL